jgi:hypothetical protein
VDTDPADQPAATRPHHRETVPIGHALFLVVEALVTGKRLQAPDGIDWSKYTA